MAYAQWVVMIIQNKIGSGQLTLKNLKVEWYVVILALVSNTAHY